MKNILLTALLVAIVAASLRGSDRKEHDHHRDQNSERQGPSSSSGDGEYIVYDSDDKYTLYDSDDKYTLYDSDDKYTLYDSDDKYTLYDSDDKYTLYDSNDRDEEYIVYDSNDRDEEYIVYDSNDRDEEYIVYDSDSEDKSNYNDRDEEYIVYDSESSDSSSSDSESDSSSSDSESHEFKHRGKNHHYGSNKFTTRGPRRGPRGGMFHNRNQQNNHPRPPRPQDEFSRQVFQNIRKTGKVILDEWNITEDPLLKNEIRAVLIGNLENLLPVAEVLIPTEVVSGPAVPINVASREHHPHSHPPPPPQPEDEFARQVFETLHQIGFEILEQWRIEQDVEVKNQIRANLIQQLSELIPAQQLEVSTTILEYPIQLEIEQVNSAPRLADENGN